MRLTRLRSAASDERGISMFIVIVAALVTSLFVAAAYAAANGDLPMSGDSKDRKSAYAAAEAGLNFYSFHLNQDSDYWTKCANVPAPNASEPNPVNQVWDGKTPTTDPRRWRNVPGSTAQYTIELLPIAPYTQCIEGTQASILDMSSGTFRLRFTGRPSPKSKLRRSIVATFRRGGFLDYLYFTDFEDKDPQAYNSASDRTTANTYCRDRYRAARPAISTGLCDEIQFVSGDVVYGPFHTNDDILTCGAPQFGRNSTDAVEMSGPEPGWVLAPGCSGQPKFPGTKKAAAKKLVLPTTNNDLLNVATTGGKVFTGTTHIRFLSNNTMNVITGSATTSTNMAVPANGVIYVKNGSGGCSIPNPPPAANYTAEPTSCGNVYVTGEYATSMTIGADNDVIVGTPRTENASIPVYRDLLKADGSDAVMGLIANNFVRVYHRVNRSSGSCTNANGTGDVTIDAAILSLQHSFIVDNYDCGAPLGDLHVNGAIAQKYRGPVGTGSRDNIATGFYKDYKYDDRLRFRSPPFFLPPVDAAWTVLRRNEQVPAR